MFNFSIIIPHKNIPDLLQRCLDSIPKRDDLQVIIVDDNSDPSIVDLKKFPGINRSNTEVIFTKEGKGAGYARNVGLKNAKGKWILFADADDYFSLDFKSFLTEYQNSNADIIYFNGITEQSAKRNRTEHINFFHELYLKNPSKAVFYLRYAFGEPWCKMVKREIIIKYCISFQETPIHNDTQYSYLVGYYCKSALICNKKIYIVSDQPQSVSKQRFFKIATVRAQVFSQKNSFLKKHHIPFYDDYLIELFWRCCVEKRFFLLIQCLLIAAKFRMSFYTILHKIIIKRKLVNANIVIKPYPEMN